MTLLKVGLMTVLLCAGGSAAKADCHFSPFAFFPERNDHVHVGVVAESRSFCAMAFKEGPGYTFTSASFGKAPPHGVLAKTGATSFAYRSFDNYHGPDQYSVKLCAEKSDGRKGCSTLIYDVTVQ